MSIDNPERTDEPAAQPAPETIVLSVRGVSKRYGPVQANDNITIDFRAGEIHALLGENGSGKSTVLGIASGAVQPDDGEVVINGEPLTTASPKEAMRLGLGMAYQTMTEVAGLTVAENLFLAAPAELRPAYGRMEEWATAEAQRLPARRSAPPQEPKLCRLPSGRCSKSSKHCCRIRRCCCSTSRPRRWVARRSIGCTN